MLTHYFGAYAQVDTLQINYIGQEQGITQLNIQEIVQDDLDYLWFSTEDGLHRFNGKQLKVYEDNPLDSLSIPDDHNRGLLIVDDTLWIASNSKGFFGLDLRAEKFFIPFDRLSEVISYHVFQLDETHLLFSSANVFNIYNRKTKQLKEVVLPHEYSENYVKAITKLQDGIYALATLSSGLLIFDLSTMKIIHQQNLDESAHNAVLLVDDQLYIGTELGLYVMPLFSYEAIKVVANEVINCIFLDEHGTFLIGTESGLMTYDRLDQSYAFQILKDQSDRVYAPLEVTSIYGDEKGNLWIGTAGEGLHYYNKYQKKFHSIEIRLDGYTKDTRLSTFQFMPDVDSTLWLGTTDNVLKYNYKTQRFKHYSAPPKALIYAMERDLNGDIWCGGFEGTGLLKYNSKQDKFEQAVVADGFNNDKTVIDIRPLKKDKLLVSTWSSGMYSYDLVNHRFEEFLVNGEKINRVRTSFIDSRQNLWLGSDQGAYRIADLGAGAVQLFSDHLPDSFAINSNRIFAINEDANSNIWLGTSSGLAQVQRDTWKTQRYYQQEGFPNDFVYSVLIDPKGKIWMGTNKGIAVLDPVTGQFVNYSEKDGLQNDEFNGKAAFHDEFGNFYFGGVDGINVFNPLAIKTNPYHPQVHLESIELFNEPIDVNTLYTDTYDFHSDENVLTFRYAANNFLNPSKVNYSYYMDGFDKGWRPATKSQNITYTNLPPGEYTFRIKATNDHGVWGDERKVKITIIPPWYDQIWFRLVVLFTLVLSVVGYMLNKSYNYKRNQIRLEYIVQERTNDLQKALSVSNAQQDSIKFLMRELKHRVKNNLQIISSLLSLQAMQINNKEAGRTLQVAKNRILTISHVENIMDSEKEHVQVDVFTRELCDNVLKLIAIEEKPNFELKYELQSAKVTNFNITYYGLMINELITNTSKYAFDSYNEKNELYIKCKIEGDLLVLEIADNGKGYQVEEIKANSIGLDLVKDMVKQLKGDIQIENLNGTKNIIRIPLIYG
ncbi:hypothetical protein N7E81_14500 [Reichenbachiella carrageenanivorans]|uniref:Histidine kinase domain-containing protein n=1 Tax=Reichenbachiella carrageenanivorans TaxID=2979869 RepID=A0ABY6D0I3_9BACT|nr:two-component regulator propeller domain-containing protein [Reichenbachiella carrageenanivorans]UXX78568.1 hypothetical protein N7E81_14500 [Reichenbachiella carrageenanivorans]